MAINLDFNNGVQLGGKLLLLGGAVYAVSKVTNISLGTLTQTKTIYNMNNIDDVRAYESLRAMNAARDVMGVVLLVALVAISAVGMVHLLTSRRIPLAMKIVGIRALSGSGK